MTEEETTSEEETSNEEEAQEESTEESFDEARAKAKIAKVNNEAANLRKRLKELEPLAQKAKELGEQGKSESEKLTEKASTAESRASKAESEVARLKVALKKGLTEVQAKRLVGETEEELTADADELLASFRDDEEEAQEAPRRPRERLRPGAAPGAKPEKNDPASLAESVPRGW